MNGLEITLTIIHLLAALILIVVVLSQSSKQQGLSGSIAGGAETFFGKNKGRTVDSMLEKATVALAVIFIITSASLTYLGTKDKTPATTETPGVTATAAPTGEVPVATTAPTAVPAQ